MNEADLAHVQETVNEEGFDYTFLYHDHFTEIDDPMFHILREKYIEASEALYSYLKMDSTEFQAPPVFVKPTLKSW
jgi:hypothetical protein